MNTMEQIVNYADNATIITQLSECSSIVNLTELIQDLYNLYQNTSSTIFYNISIENFDCQSSTGKYFEQIIFFTKSVSLQIQISLASLYFNYITSNGYSFHGFFIEQNERFLLSSITLNSIPQSGACSSGAAVQIPLCSLNSSTPECIEFVTNPWIFNCSINSTTSTNPSTSIISDHGSVLTIISTVLNSWQIGLICGLSIFSCLILLLIVVCFYRRCLRTKRISLSCENLFDDKKFLHKSVIPHDSIFQHVVHVTESKQSINTLVSWIHDGIYKQEIFLDPTTIHATIFLNKSNESIHPSNNNQSNMLLRKSPSTSSVPQSICTTSIDRFQLSTNDESFDDLNEIIIDCSYPIQYINRSYTDDNLCDEDAWMSILAVANAELDLLNQLENEQNGMITTL
ncbi:hypothetical protein I4U23_003206 [Adineta vaga]|nr:hypothetical protein I4U23_003206 [Adineta vaga]